MSAISQRPLSHPGKSAFESLPDHVLHRIFEQNPDLISTCRLVSRHVQTIAESSSWGALPASAKGGELSARHVNKLALSVCGSTPFLSVSNGMIDDNKVAYLIACVPNICRLHLAHCSNVTDQTLGYLGQLSRLTHLNLNHCSQVTDVGLISLQRATQMRELLLQRCYLITDIGLLALAQLQKLQKLDLTDCTQIQTPGVCALRNCRQLETLNLSGCIRFSDDLFTLAGHFTNLRKLDLSEINQTSDKIASFLSRCPHISFLKLKSSFPSLQDPLAQLSGCSNLAHLDLRSEFNSHEPLKALSCLQKLTALFLGRGSDVSANQLTSLTTLTQLAILNLESCYGLDERGFASIAQLTTLRDLYLRGSRDISESALRTLPQLKALTRLNLGDCTTIGDQALNDITQLPEVRDLTLDNCSRLTPNGLQKLERCKDLINLSCNSCQIESATLTSFQHLTNIETLSLRGCFKIKDCGLRAIEAFVKLRSLNLGYCKVSNAGLNYLSGLSHLSQLQLDHCRSISQRGLWSLTHLTLLQVISLLGCKCTDNKGMRALSNLPRLTTCAVSDASNLGLQQLARSTNLKALRLFGSPLTDRGIKLLAPLENLTALYINNCYNLQGKQLKAIGAFNYLKALSLKFTTEISEEGLLDLSNLTQLNYFAAPGGNSTTDRVLEMVGTWRALIELDLSRSPLITSQGLKHLRQLKVAKNISLVYCPQITETDHLETWSHLPNTQFSF